jgi:hypothetical protein
MNQRMSSVEIDKTIQAAMDLLPERERDAVDACVADLAGTITGLPGGKGFGVARARELVFSLGMYLNRQDAA